MIGDENKPFSLEIDFLLLPSLEEMQDTSGDDVYAGPLMPFVETGPALEKECRDKINRWDEIVIRQVATQDSMVAGAFPSDVIMQMAAWLGSAAGCSLFYKLLKMWSGLRKGRKIVFKMPRGLHVEATQMSERQFIKLLKGLQECGLSISKGGSYRQIPDRIPYTEDEEAFEMFLVNLKSSGLEVFDERNMAKLQSTLYGAFRDSISQIRHAPDFEQRVKRARAKHQAWEEAGVHNQIAYLSDLEKQTVPAVDKLEAKPKKTRIPRKKISKQS